MKTNIYKIYLLFFLTLLISGCATSSSLYNYSNNNKTLYLGNDKNNLIEVKFSNPFIQNHQSFRCNVNSYTLRDNNTEYGKLFVEYIDVGSRCEWNGLPSSFFESNISATLKLNSLETVEEFDIASYNFKTFRVNNDSYLSMIYIYGGNVDRFILDYNGKLYTKLLKTFKFDYKSKIYFQKRFLGNYDDSLVRKNMINNYFKEERWIITPDSGINISL